MIRSLALAALLLFAQDPKQDEPAAADLLKKLDEATTSAKTLKYKFDLSISFGGGMAGGIKGDITVKGEGRALMNAGPYGGLVRKGQDQPLELRSDGNVVVCKGGPGGDGTMKPQSTAREVSVSLRSAVSTLSILSPFMEMFGRRGGHHIPTARGPAKISGKEKVGDRELTILEYKLTFSDPEPREFAVKAWIDAAKNRVVKRELTSEGRESFTETFSDMAFDEEIADDLFAIQTPATLAAGRLLQLQKSIELYTRFVGAPPRQLSDLVNRPGNLEVDIFWPGCGFWIGGALPDVAYSVTGATATLGKQALAPGDYRAVVAPSDRLKKHYTGRVHLALLRAAVEAYSVAYSDFPTASADLSTKPKMATLWPEGGFVNGALPVDPWGKPYKITFKESVRIEVEGYASLRIRAADVTAEERKALEAGGAARLKESPEITGLFEKLRSDEMVVRQEGTDKLAAWGPAILGLVDARILLEKDTEVLSRLKDLRDRNKIGPAAWSTELKPLLAVVAFGPGGAVQSANERNASATLKTFTTAEADFRSNDRDADQENNFWVKDVAGLSGLDSNEKTTPAKERATSIRLIEDSAAEADASPTRGVYPVLKGKEPAAKSGYYFAVLTHYIDENAATKAYDDGTGHSSDRFGFIAYPADFGTSGKRWFMVNEENTIWTKEATDDEPPTTFPQNPPSEGWSKMD